MTQIPQALITGVTSFTATNIDDIVILTLFFAKVNATFRPRHIVAGQYLGFLGLVLASLPGYFGGIYIPRPWLGWLGLLPIAIGIYHIFRKDAEETTVQTVSFPKSVVVQKRSPLGSLLSPPTYQVAVVTLANGGDNIGIYIPLFANSTLMSLGIILGVFLIMVGLWCGMAYQLTRHPWAAKTLVHYGGQIFPFVLIGLGVFIFMDSGTHKLFLPQPP
jgi:cadmium resistance transport/sequestration family protein